VKEGLFLDILGYVLSKANPYPLDMTNVIK
jgi:hypothetical protein